MHMRRQLCSTFWERSDKTRTQRRYQHQCSNLRAFGATLVSIEQCILLYLRCLSVCSWKKNSMGFGCLEFGSDHTSAVTEHRFVWTDSCAFCCRLVYFDLDITGTPQPWAALTLVVFWSAIGQNMCTFNLRASIISATTSKRVLRLYLQQLKSKVQRESLASNTIMMIGLHKSSASILWERHQSWIPCWKQPQR